jgi:hypothetical protein
MKAVILDNDIRILYNLEKGELVVSAEPEGNLKVTTDFEARREASNTVQNGRLQSNVKNTTNLARLHVSQ